MDFTFSPEQLLLRDSLQNYLRAHHPFKVRSITEQLTAQRPTQLWRAFADELGLLGAALPEAAGGLGGGPVEIMIIMEEFGRAHVLEPFLETVVVSAGLLSRAGGARANDLIGQLIAGDAIVAFGWGEPDTRYAFDDVSTTASRTGDGWRLNGKKTVVSGAPLASHLIVSARTGGSRRDQQGISLFLLDKATAGVTCHDYATIDGRCASDISLQDVVLPTDALLGEADHARNSIALSGDEAIAAVCAEGVGVMQRLHADTVDYTKQRRQFGQPLANFQVLQHRMVDMYIAIEQSISATYLATLSLGAAGHERARTSAAAKAMIAKACRFVGQNAVQLHGGMGMSNELAVSHYFRRATVIESEFGPADYHIARYAALLSNAS